jgi:acetylornithine/succinyldiaminopimelate/putrescine aminotransferase
VIRLVPPFSSTPEQIDEAAEILAAALADVGEATVGTARLDTKV